MEISGVIELIADEEQVSERFKKRDFVIDAQEENSSYENFVKFQLVQDNCAIIDLFKIGDRVKVNFTINGRKWINPKGEEIYFNSLKAWKVTEVAKTTEKAFQKPVDNTSEHTSLIEPDWLKADNENPNSDTESSDEDDLPF